MPITAFNSFSDGLDPSQRSREHFIADMNLDDGAFIYEPAGEAHTLVIMEDSPEPGSSSSPSRPVSMCARWMPEFAD